MNCSPKSMPVPTDRPTVLLGGDVVDAALPARADLSDWVELMEVVEALCPVWPPQERGAQRYKL